VSAGVVSSIWPIDVAEIRYRRFGYVWPSTEQKYRLPIGKMSAIE
jgi:hypothetical protein